MKEIKRLRSYLSYLANNTPNHPRSKELLDDLDLVESYIESLQLNQDHASKDPNYYGSPYREALAKVCAVKYVHIVEDRFYLMRCSLEDHASMMEHEVPITVHNFMIHHDLVGKFIKDRSELYLALADELVSIQEAKKSERRIHATR